MRRLSIFFKKSLVSCVVITCSGVYLIYIYIFFKKTKQAADHVDDLVIESKERILARSMSLHMKAIPFPLHNRSAHVVVYACVCVCVSGLQSNCVSRGPCGTHTHTHKSYDIASQEDKVHLT